eukprot:TRINITY_DN12541_c0_g1_i8.p2 TRINITY_DN12541_c0_g1~~TRINITY_DN12541_c0_g1_i8.p2  ORF type:complete len:203 (+),score=-30.60 TRINITY_DN12541_c0_g1_i8:152-760(+)
MINQQKYIPQNTHKKKQKCRVCINLLTYTCKHQKRQIFRAQNMHYQQSTISHKIGFNFTMLILFITSKQCGDTNTQRYKLDSIQHFQQFYNFKLDQKYIVYSLIIAIQEIFFLIILHFQKLKDYQKKYFLYSYYQRIYNILLIQFKIVKLLKMLYRIQFIPLGIGITALFTRNKKNQHCKIESNFMRYSALLIMHILSSENQ